MDPQEDLLCWPSDPSTPHERVRFVPWRSLWDGGPFRSFAQRHGVADRVPVHLRHAPSAAPFLEATHPTPHDEQQGFYQTWFFFGLLAEFCSLNNLDDGTRLNHSNLQELMDALYSSCVDIQHGYIQVTYPYIKEAVDWLLSSLPYSPIGPSNRYAYLRDCLRFTFLMINSPHVHLEAPIRNSICALAEGFTIALSTIHRVPHLSHIVGNERLSFAWGLGYLDESVEALMTRRENGWCQSDVEQIRHRFQNLNSQHFISRLRKWGPVRDHSDCSRQKCVTAQIRGLTYQLSHSMDGCACSVIHVDIGRVQEILRTSTTYPILRIDCQDGDLGKLSITPEPYDSNTPYVAFSHVWADGLGNYEDNSLQTCQVLRMADLVRNLQRHVNPGAKDDATYLRVWVDTLCIPIEKTGKTIALGRIADVYRQAKHVLVLDSSINPPSLAINVEELHPAELCFRALASSTWMRRLWTLQEGALANSLYFQFGNQPINLAEQRLKLQKIGLRDFRSLALARDTTLLMNELEAFFQTSGQQDTHYRIGVLQSAVYFRSVSFGDDEPLCIANLLSLNSEYIMEVDGRDERMARMWELLAAKAGGIQPSLIFYVDNPLPLKGWGWAPRSLLTSGSGTDSALDYPAVHSRWWSGRGSNLDPRKMGIPTSLGLGVMFPGMEVKLSSLRKGGPLRLWKRLVLDPFASAGSYLLLRHASTGKWYRMLDYFVAKVVMTWPAERQIEWRKTNPRPIYDDLRIGDMALIKDSGRVGEGGPGIYLLVRSQDDQGINTSPVPVYACRTVMMMEVDEVYGRGLDVVQVLADEAANHQVTKALLDIRDRSSQAYQDALEGIEKFMKARAKREFERNENFSRFGRECLGTYEGDKMWGYIPYLLPYQVVMEDLPSDQVWVVDRDHLNTSVAEVESE